MASLNRVFLMGHLGVDPKLETTKGGTPVARLFLLVNSTWKNSKGEKVEETLPMNCTVWGKAAEAAAEHLRKGSGVLVEGRLKKEEDWVDKATGEKRQGRIGLTVERWQFSGPKPDGGAARASAAPSGTESARAADDDEVPF